MSNSPPNPDDDYFVTENVVTQTFAPQLEPNTTVTKQYEHQMRMMYLITYCIILILGMTLNFTFLLIGCCRFWSFMKAAVWILVLAVTHLVFCVSVVFQLLYAYHEFKWHYGTSICKLSAYITYGSMYSTAAMLSLWKVSSALSKSACMRKCKNFNNILIAFSWSLAAILALPSMFSREIQNERCIDDYDFDKDSSKITTDGIVLMKAAIVMRFLFGLIIPAFVMSLSFCMMSRPQCELCKNQAQVICAAQVAYIVCWGPQIFLTLIQATANQSVSEEIFQYGLPAATVLAAAHCVTCPLIYILVGWSSKMKWMAHDPNHIRGILKI